ncbi:hypothetical protein HOP50_01g08950 [Chloropicon primus]|nr:hypothetical protein HOP50_01g08950 [Chloropicon primus]
MFGDGLGTGSVRVRLEGWNMGKVLRDDDEEGRKRHAFFLFLFFQFFWLGLFDTIPAIARAGLVAHQLVDVTKWFE